eukprot:TRINITY_DN1547_c0_g1_i1.p1 TRINITY_DN1547_c0_g1~~TRINITY_DN1547_c0_g1_i1.p1  ORF type:complete len:332 (-),score=170.46 TRINITY_DN1547_c0_g1_i1:69-1064(-)
MLSKSFFLIIYLILILNLISFNCNNIDSSDIVEGTAGIRATWVSIYKHNTSPQDTYNSFQQLKSNGVNRVYVDVWNNGIVYFNSSTMRNFAGNGCIGPDHLQWAVDAGSQLGLQVYAWFEYGLMACYGTSATGTFATTASKKGWLIGSADSFMWMNAKNDDVLNFLAGILHDALNYHGLAGVQLDDHFAQPVSLIGKNSAVMTDAAKKIISHVNAPGRISLSPATLSYALSNYNVDWGSWSRSNIGFFEYVPQIYRTDYSSFSSELSYTIQQVGTKTLLAGVRCNGSGANTAWSQLSQMITLAQNDGIGVVVWYSVGIIETYPSQFKQLWG